MGLRNWEAVRKAAQVLYETTGKTNAEIAAEVKCADSTIVNWARKFKWDHPLRDVPMTAAAKPELTPDEVAFNVLCTQNEFVKLARKLNTLTSDFVAGIFGGTIKLDHFGKHVRNKKRRKGIDDIKISDVIAILEIAMKGGKDA